MVQNATYSFLDVQCAVTGPGGQFSISEGGIAEEGITIEYDEDKTTLTVGADGSFMHSLHGGNAGRATIRLLKTSPINAQLSAMYNSDRITAANWGRNVISIRNPVTGDTFTLQGCAFAKFPTNTNAKEGGVNEWVFACGSIDPRLGTGSPSAN